MTDRQTDHDESELRAAAGGLLDALGQVSLTSDRRAAVEEPMRRVDQSLRADQVGVGLAELESAAGDMLETARRVAVNHDLLEALATPMLQLSELLGQKPRPT